MNLYYKIFKPKKYITESGKEIYEYPGFTLPIIIALLLFTALSVKITGFSLNTLVKNSHKLLAILNPMFKPNFSYFSSVVGPLLDTIKMSFLGSFLGAVVAVPFAFLASHNMVKSKIINWIIKLLFSILRTIPTLVSALIATYIFGLGAFEGNVRYAAILGYVGAGGLGLLINENINWRDYNRVGMILLMLLITVFIIENISSYFRRKLN